MKNIFLYLADLLSHVIGQIATNTSLARIIAFHQAEISLYLNKEDMGTNETNIPGNEVKRVQWVLIGYVIDLQSYYSKYL